MAKRVKVFYHASFCGFKEIVIGDEENPIEYAYGAVNNLNVDMEHLMFKTDDGIVHDFPMQDADIRFEDLNEKRTVG